MSVKRRGDHRTKGSQLKPLVTVLAIAALVATTQFASASAADPSAGRAAKKCGLLTKGEVDDAFYWPDGIGLECSGGGSIGQLSVRCEDAGDSQDVEDCEDAAELTAAESYGLKIKDDKAGDHLLRKIRRKANDKVLGYPAWVKVQDDAPTLTSVTVVGPKRKLVTIGVFSYRGGQRAGTKALAKDAVPRYF